jgi:ribosomal protein L3 glutamine methyltransferase
MNVLQAIERASARLDEAGVSFGHGTDNAFDEAAWLVLWRLGLPLDDLDGVAECELAATETAAIEALVETRIQSRKPAAYLTGEAWLQGVPFTVDERAIVPRSLIAELIADGSIDTWLPNEPQRVLDLCTGNGSLALAVAQLNLRRHGLQERIKLRQGDGLAAADGRYHVILCNPPYVNADSMQELPPEFQAEPSLALAGGEDGMDFIRPLLQRANQHLTEGGLLVLEIGHERAFFEAAFPALQVVYLPTQNTDDQVLLVTADSLNGAAKAHPKK